MAAFSSWFAKASSSRHGLLADSKQELPRWRSPSPMAASMMIPPPIVQSTYLTSPQATPKSVMLERPSPLQDRQSELEADLQFLLDAQAEGLVKGLEGGATDDQASTGSTTPTAQSVRSASARRATRPVRRKPGLRSVRKGIYNSIVALSAVKDEELRAVDAEALDKEGTLAQIDEWEQKRAGLQEATQRADDGEETVRAQRLRQQTDVLQEEINHVELQLSDMKTRHRKLVRQVAAVENSVQAKLASYTSSLSMLEADVQKFLSVKPADSGSRPQSRDGKASVWQLPPKRRTLEMAREQWDGDRDAVLQQRQSIEHEKTALDQGAAVWKDMVAQVTDFEKRLRTEMAGLSMSSSHSAWEDPPPQLHEQDNSVRLKELLAHLDTVLDSLETKYKLAEERDWKLLIAAIGAELDALGQGKAILENVLGVTAPSSSSAGQNGHGQEGREDLVAAETATNGSSSRADTEDAGDEIHGLDKSFETARPPARRMDSDSETDDPDPDLLFSRHDLSDG
ncbi:hypothetical protein LTR36_002885 [Oleoguttula mirabilis]|uniref:Uncharacterized protein n=1 Tax=Oleoguttula mirabilis TaxID=1507867 RepID=A0AAV9JM03_9PEZI|nr:hypothetical protein LTR36_002885 [Oleoguttula mirabilis]